MKQPGAPMTLTPSEEVARTDAGGHEVEFNLAEGRHCSVRSRSDRSWDLYIDGRHKVRNASNFSFNAGELHFSGQGLLFGGTSVRLASRATTVMAGILGLQADSLEAKPVNLLLDGDIRLVSARWMLQRPSGFVVQRCQDLPAEAFLEAVDAADAYSEPDRVIVLSYPWLSKGHPDPAGFHCRLLLQYLSKHVSFFDGEDFGIFWDFMCLPQPGPDGTRSASETESLKRGLGAINFLYGSPNTVVVQMKAIPEDPAVAVRPLPYDRRGWCLFEVAVANIKKPSLRVLDLSVPAATQALAAKESSWACIQKVATRANQPPLHPDSMRASLEQAVFTNGVDQGLVESKYEEFFYFAAGSTKYLDFANFSTGGAWGSAGDGDIPSDGWTDQQMALLSLALPGYVQGEFLRLCYHICSDIGLYAVLRQIPKLKHLNHLDFSGCAGVSGKAFRVLGEQQMPRVRVLRLHRTGLDDEGTAILASQLACFPELQFLCLSDCRKIQEAGFSALAKHLPIGLRFLSLGQTSIDDAGLGELARGLSRLQCLRRLDLRGCDGIGRSGLAALSSSLPDIPVMESKALSGRCYRDAGELVPRRVGVDAPSASFCHWCCRRVPLGDLCHICACGQDRRCSDCLRGSLILPVHLRATSESEVLAKAWASKGREEQQLVWL